MVLQIIIVGTGVLDGPSYGLVFCISEIFRSFLITNTIRHMTFVFGPPGTSVPTYFSVHFMGSGSIDPIDITLMHRVHPSTIVSDFHKYTVSSHHNLLYLVSHDRMNGIARYFCRIPGYRTA